MSEPVTGIVTPIRTRVAWIVTPSGAMASNSASGPMSK